MPAVVTVAAGFLGSPLCVWLRGAGCSVHGIDNLLTAQRRNEELFEAHARFRFLHPDVSAPYTIGGPAYRVDDLATLTSPVDIVQHLPSASQADDVRACDTRHQGKTLMSTLACPASC